MKKLVVFLSVILLIPGYILANQPNIKNIDRQDMPSFLGYVPGELIVQFNLPSDKVLGAAPRGNTVSLGVASLDDIADKYQVTDMRQLFKGAKPVEKAGKQFDLSQYFVVTFDKSADLDLVASEYRNDPNVISVEKNGIHSVYATPNDGYFSYQWYHNQASDHDIDSPEAWNIETGNTNVIIALLDSGTRYYHPDLGGANASPSNPGASRGNMWINTAELNGTSGYDDDGNGYVDDWIGWDFVTNASNCWSGEDCTTPDNDPRDFNGHGTHTAGIMGMLTNDGYGMAGVAGGWGNGSQAVTGNGVKIMILRMGYSYNYGGTEYGVVLMDAAASAFYYAANNGARIASCSWGSSNSGGIGAAVDYFIASGGIVFVAAGNANNETADYLNARGDCVSVAATDENDNGASFTTYGTWVDICAPGNNIYSTYHDHTDPNTNYWASMSGTSMATPMAAAVGGLIWSHNLSWTASQVKNQLFSSADNIDAYLSSKYIGKMGAGRINAYNAVNTGTPAPVAAFTGSPTSGCAPLTVNFTDQSTGSITSWSWTFGDGGSSTSQNPSHQYTSAGNYTVTLTVTGPGGSDGETKTNYITVSVPPTAGFTGSPTSGDVPLTVNFTNQSSGATSYSWNFGDSQTSTATNPSHTYTSTGTFTVTLTATNSCGSDQEVKTNYITVTCTPPVAGFSGSPTSGNVPLTVNFTNSSTGATSYSWNFGDSQTSTATNPSHTYTSTGTFTVTLTATNSCGSDQEVKTNYITVTCTPPVAGFTGSPTSGNAPLTVSFTDQSTGASSWSWDFGDGVGTSTAQNPNYTYNSPGTYTVSLTATNSCGSDDEIKTNYITVNEAGGYASLPYSTGFESGTFDQYWTTQSSGDGRIRLLTTNTPHSGSYHMVMDNAVSGTYSQNEAWLHLNLAGKSQVELTFWWKEFNDEAQTQDGVFLSSNGGSSFTKVYSLTGGTSTYEEIVLDIDALAASYGLSLTSTFVIKFQQYDNYPITTDGMAFDDISVISLEAPPVADFSGDPTSGTAPLTVSFTDLSTNNPTSWSWNFGDGGSSTSQNPSHQYMSAGTYTVTLTATNAYGSDQEVKTDYITVNAPGAWTTITYDDFESGTGNYTDGGADCSWYTGYTYAWEGSCAMDIQDNSGVASSFYHTNGYNVSGYTDMEIEFYFVAISMETGEDFWVQYYNGSSWQTLAAFAQGYDFSNTTWYVVTIPFSNTEYNFPTNAKLRFMCDASGNSDDVYIDAITWSGMSGSSSIGNVALLNKLDREPLAVPNDFALSQNTPNPFNPSTSINFALPEATHVQIAVYNIIGQRIATLTDADYPAGEHSVIWNGMNDNGKTVSSGVYFYQIKAGDFVASKKMVLMK
jgi:PKD repeat protein